MGFRDGLATIEGALFRVCPRGTPFLIREISARRAKNLSQNLHSPRLPCTRHRPHKSRRLPTQSAVLPQARPRVSAYANWRKVSRLTLARADKLLMLQNGARSTKLALSSALGWVQNCTYLSLACKAKGLTNGRRYASP